MQNAATKDLRGSVRATSHGAREAPISAVLPLARLRLFRLLTAAVVFLPIAGTLLAAVLAFRMGVDWTELAALACAYVLATLGVTIGFHRYFAHRAFQARRWLQLVFVVAGSCALQGPLLYWVSTHRRHHRFSDTEEDPHSPHHTGAGEGSRWAGFWHGHMGWMFSRRVTNVARFAPDILRDRTIFRLQNLYWVWGLVGLAAPFVVTLAVTGRWLSAFEIFLWAGPVRIALVHQASWAVGSFSHLVGGRPFETNDRSANNAWVAVFAFGEGLQNNHHAFPQAARHGLRPGEPDLSGLVIDVLQACGLIWDVNHPTPEMIRGRLRNHTEGEHHGA